jgi:hypothetical protein
VPGIDRGFSRSTILLRGLIAALIVPVLLAGTLDLHSSELPHGALDGPGVVLADARHPLAPQHLESSIAVRIPPCLACLLHSNTSCGAVTAPALSPEPIVCSAGATPEVAAPPLRLAFRLASRGPPVA